MQWLAALTFFFVTGQTRVEALDLAPDLEQAVLTQLIPALYLERVAGRSHAETRHRLQSHTAIPRRWITCADIGTSDAH